ncbi:helicase-exonuclease AddAB subunit AddA [Calderihabitans maritimus]|uniref:ATP-dependent helicase/nuclease subunit A n=1 Tax=Calderihabitans maritimus TaxID=1246530 RepID=A0A1Z5HPF9_9FIRM|nr:helicase-exonuclease AddAB subunit AddA [Calderihabitans maritimus]GAW91170.1 ATP-dependent helicase/nuclease subunit A [Calderihabitans maritimus]
MVFRQKDIPEPWTEPQWEAIVTRGTNLLVSAAAGAGKTAVLVERIIHLITGPDPVEINRLLVVTFTEAAAAEMRQRIGKALEEALERDPDNAYLRRQRALLNQASISTIHSFCLEVIRRYYYRLDLDPAFRVADENEAALLRLETVDDLFEELYASRDEEFLTLVEHYGGNRNDENLKNIVLDLYQFTCAQPWPWEKLREAVAAFKVEEATPMENLPWTGAVLEYIAMELERMEFLLRQALELCSYPGGPEAYRENLEQDLQMVGRLAAYCREGSWEQLRSNWLGISFSKLKRIKKEEVDEALADKVKSLRQTVKDKLKELGDTYFQREPEALLQDINRLGPLMEGLVNLVYRFSQAYSRSKQARGLLDFADLEHYCLKLLLDPEAGPGELVASPIARELQEQYEEVLVDEYQDVNAVQDAILNLVSRQDGNRSNLFMVGDVKQSIYRFRLAEPGMFLRKYRDYSDSEQQAGRRIDLNANFRSRREIVDGVNFLFRQILTPRVGEMAYDSAAELVCMADYPEVTEENCAPSVAGPVELHLVARENETESSYTEDYNETVEGEEEYSSRELEALEREAHVIARRIKEMVQGTPEKPGPAFSVWDKAEKKYRPLKYRDIVILLRSTRHRANVFLEALSQWGIPAYADLGTGYFSSPEVETVMSLLRIIDNPRQDIHLAAVLRSPLFGFTAEELARIRLYDRRGDFYAAVLAAARDSGSEPLRSKLRDFLAKLERWRTTARRSPLGELIWQIYRETGYPDFAGGLPGGAQRRANLLALYERARQFDSFARQGLFRFLRFVERLRRSEGDLGTARALGENEDVVRIMSIHKSKGLEFPVVFVADLGRQFNWRDLQGDLLFHPGLGLGPKVVDPQAGIKYPSLAYLAVRERCRLESLAEELRILYVALTRARERLVLVGSARELEKCCRQWCGMVSRLEWPLPDGYLAAARTYLDWICSAVARHSCASPLRNLAGVGEKGWGEVSDDPSRWKVEIWGLSEGKKVSVPVAASPEGSPVWDKIIRQEPLSLPERPFREEVHRRLNWRYPYRIIVTRPAKLSVSELKRRFDYQDADREAVFLAYRPQLAERPRFLQQSTELTGAEKGLAFHLVMQHLDLSRPLDEEEIKRQVEAMVFREILTEEQARAVRVEDVVTFFQHPLGTRIQQSYRSLRREVPFSLGLPAREVYPDLPPEVAGEDRVLVQGIIDCFLEEEDGFLLLDFKTDRFGSRKLPEAVERYRVQINLYARALQAIYRKPVKEAYIYFVALARAVPVITGR